MIKTCRRLKHKRYLEISRVLRRIVGDAMSGASDDDCEDEWNENIKGRREEMRKGFVVLPERIAKALTET
jgi:hypothetical protein